MKLDRYPVNQLDAYTFQFFSEGRNGRFEERILFEPISKNLFNLAFGVWDPFVCLIDDQRELRNGDSDKILATVAATILTFLNEYPQANIAATGSVQPGRLSVRTRKYQMGINKNYDALSEMYNVYGFIAERNVNSQIIGAWPNWPGKWEVFLSTGQYDAFLINIK